MSCVSEFIAAVLFRSAIMFLSEYEESTTSVDVDSREFSADSTGETSF